MLTSRFQLHDIQDIEAFCTTLIKNSKHTIPAQQHEDLLAYLIATAWQLSGLDKHGKPTNPPTGYKRGNPKYPPLFSVYAYNILRLRITDWQRKTHGRTTWQFATHTHQRPNPQVLSENQPGLGTTNQPSLVGDPTHSDPTLRRLLHHRNSESEQPYPQPNRTPTRNAA